MHARGTMSSASRRTFAVLLTAALALLAGNRSAAAFDGEADITLGDAVRATLSGEPGEVHRFAFFRARSVSASSSIFSLPFPLSIASAMHTLI